MSDPQYDTCECGHFRWCHAMGGPSCCMGYADECLCTGFVQWEPKRQFVVADDPNDPPLEAGP